MTTRKPKESKIATLKGLPHPDSPKFKLWLSQNIAHFTELDYKTLTSTYNRAKKAGDIP